MKNILCYGDSNTYGLDPSWLTSGMSRRHDISVRWTGRLQERLGPEYRIIEEGLNGRTTVFDDPTSPGRNGLTHLNVCVESHMPLDAVILMLGTNDTKPIFNASPFEIAMGMARLVKTVLNPFLYMPGETPPKVLVAAPVPLGDDMMKLPNVIADKQAIEKSRQLAGSYRQISETLGCYFLDLATVAKTAPGEGIHLTAEAHEAVSAAMERAIRDMFSK